MTDYGVWDVVVTLSGTASFAADPPTVIDHLFPQPPLKSGILLIICWKPASTAGGVSQTQGGKVRVISSDWPRGAAPTKGVHSKTTYHPDLPSSRPFDRSHLLCSLAAPPTT